MVTAVEQKTKWVFDPSHSRVGFSVRHFGISETEGLFRNVDGTVMASNPDFSDMEVSVVISAASIDTGDAQRDNHLRSVDFFQTDQFPEITFRSSKIEVASGALLKLTGDLFIRGVTKTVSLDVEFGGVVARDPFGNTKAGFYLSGRVNRKDWGIVWNTALDQGGVAVSEWVKISCHIQLLKKAI